MIQRKFHLGCVETSGAQHTIERNVHYSNECGHMADVSAQEAPDSSVMPRT